MARRKSSRSSHQPLPSWIWLVTGLTIGLSAAIVLRSGFEWPRFSSPQSNPQNSEYPAKKERNFDFYTLLPELEVVVPEDKKSTASKIVEPNAHYILQVGSFKNFKDADELKASLALMGIESDIEKVAVNNQTWHRVRIGPNSNQRELQAIKNRLARERIDSLLLKIRE